MNEAFNQKISEIRTKLPQVFRRIPGIAKIEGLKFIADNFKHQGFEEKPGQYKKWPRKKKGTKPTLIGEKRGGGMRRGWQVTANNAQAVFTNQKPYAGVHNEGLTAGRPPGFDMPQRQMIGDSEALDKMIENKLDKMANDVFM